MSLLLLLLACVQNEPRPFVGACAEYPDGAWTYGEIGIGTCLAGPVELAFAGDEADPVLLVTNANPYLVFDGGSLLAIPWSELDLETGRNALGDLDAAAVPLPSFAAGLAVADDGLGLVSVRMSEGERTREVQDEVWLLDLGDPASPALSSRGTDGGAEVTVQYDPVDVAIDPVTGFAFAANRTSHSISVMDLTADPVEVIPPWPEAAFRKAPFDDADGSGSNAEIAELEVDDEEAVPDDRWTLDWVEGSWRLWTPGSEGLARYTTTGQDYVESNYGTELSIEDHEDVISEVSDPSFGLVGVVGRLYLESEGDLYLAEVDEFLGDWALYEDPVVEAREDAWDAELGGPCSLATDEALYLFFDGNDGESWAIGAATSSDAYAFRRVSGGDPILEPAGDHEAERIADPEVLWDPQIDRYRMYYSAWDGARWTVGHATSEDLSTWTADETPIFSLADEGIDVAAPEISQQPGLFRMWYARREAGEWSIGAAESPDGTRWTDLGTAIALDEQTRAAEDPPGVAMQAQVSDTFVLSGESAGIVHKPIAPGETFSLEVFGYTLRVVTGQHLGPRDGGAASWGGLRVDSVVRDLGLAWLTQWDRSGDPSIALAVLDGDTLAFERGAVLEASGEGFDADGAWSPVVWSDGGEMYMLYGGIRGERSTIGLATSSDGRTWERQGQVLGLVDEAWDGAAIWPGSVVARESGGYRLWYTGSNGDLLRIGSATSDDGLTWSREEDSERRPWAFAPGAPGEWDDSGVRDPWVVVDEDGQHLWYAGSDGDEWRVGYAFRASSDDEWERSTNAWTEETRPVIGALDGGFHQDGVQRPVAARDSADSRWQVWYAGLDEGTARVGLAEGEEPDRLHIRPQRATLGDTLSFLTERGNEDAEAIPLDTTVDGRSVTGEGLVALYLDDARGFLYAGATHVNYIFVLDVRDDSATGTADSNYLDIEAILVGNSEVGGAGFRAMAVRDDYLYALDDSPEAVWIFDLGAVADDDVADMLYDAQVGWLPTPRGREADEGTSNIATIGPGALAMHPDGKHLYVTNFNTNSLGVYDLSLGAWGELVAEVENLGENPYGLAISPDGRYAVVAHYTGEVSEDNTASSTLAILDADASSEGWLDVLTWVVNE